MQKISKKHLVKIPKDVHLIYTNKKKTITFINNLHKKSLVLNVQVFVSKSKNFLKISQLSFVNLPRNKQKCLHLYQNHTFTLIKQYLIEVSVILCKKLQVVGVGYRLSTIDNLKNKLLLFKLGYSHFLYFKVQKTFEIFSLKMIKLFIFCNYYQKLNQLASKIRLCKKPEPYKGKGILYVEEKILLKKH